MRKWNEIVPPFPVVWLTDIFHPCRTLLNLSLTLLLSLPFHHNSTDAPPRRHPALPVHLHLWPTFFAVVLLHWLLSLAWTLGIRDQRRFSLAGISYVTLVGVLGIFFGSLGGKSWLMQERLPAVS